MLAIVLALAMIQGPVVAQADQTERARVHFERATKAYNLGDFTVALAEYRAAYELHPLPAFLFNIGQCHYQLGEYERAVFFYEGFLRESPSTDHRRIVEEQIIEAKRLIAASKAAKPPEETPNITEPPAVVVKAAEEPAPSAPPPAQADEGSGWLLPAIGVAGGVVVVGSVVALAIALTTPRSGSLDTIDARGVP